MPVRFRRSRATGAVAVVVVASVIPLTSSDQTSSPLPRIRHVNPVIAAAIARGIERSATFRRLAEAIESTDGIVYITEGRCGRSVNACLH